MSKRAIATSFVLSQNSSVSLQQQLEQHIRQAIQQGALSPGEKLPATRGLSKQLNLSRNTICAAYDSLKAEGYLNSRHGSATRVSDTLPEFHINTATAALNSTQSHQNLSQASPPILTDAAKRFAQLPRLPSIDHRSSTFRLGAPALDAFPIDLWEKLNRHHWAKHSSVLLRDMPQLGYERLRQCIAMQLQTSRGYAVKAEQIVITQGASQAFDAIARILVSHDTKIWIEDPGYTASRSVWLSTGAKLGLLPIDLEGAQLPQSASKAASAEASKGGIISLTPNNQFPLGIRMSEPRRAAFVQWARKNHHWIVEDDYDGEYRYEGKPSPALSALAPERSLYIGTFSKSLFPGLRLAYLVMPQSWLNTGSSRHAKHPME